MTDPWVAVAVAAALAVGAVAAGDRLGRRAARVEAEERVAWLAEELARVRTETATAGGNPNAVRPYRCRSCERVVVTGEELPVCYGEGGLAHGPVPMEDLRAP